MELDAFAELVTSAIDGLPSEFRERLENVQVDAQEWPDADELSAAGLRSGERRALLGLYHGVPLTERSSRYMAFPDRITIFMGPIMGITGGDPVAIAEQVRHTVVHEIAHFYGIDDERLEELGAY